MTLQQEISLQNNQTFIDQTMDVLIEGFTESTEDSTQLALGRSYRDAPEIDGLVFVESHPQAHQHIQVGQIIPVKIHGAMVYDLTGIHNPIQL
jgi:ribosomal protein S12 methylthiotransferase